jgi:hypothetical protein
MSYVGIAESLNMFSGIFCCSADVQSNSTSTMRASFSTALVIIAQLKSDTNLLQGKVIPSVKQFRK